MNARINPTPAQAGLDSLFAPRSVAVVGASQDTTKIRGRLLKTLIDGGFAGPIYPVNPSSARIQGLAAYADVSALPEAVDLVLVAVAADQVMAVLEQCRARGCRSAAIFSAGANGLAPGERLQDHVQAFARRSGMRILGPNCEGFLDAQTGLIATFSPTLEFVAPRIPALLDGRARVSIVSQSGAMAFALFSRARQLHIPIRHLVSTGNEADVDLLEVAEHLIRAGETRALLLFVEGFRDARRFARVAQMAADAGIALVVAKIGQSGAGQRAAVSHTAHLTGADTAYEAAFHRWGAMRVQTPGEMLAVAAALSANALPRGRRVAIVSTSGGAGGWAADICEQAGLEVPELDPAFKAQLAAIVPDYGSAENPVDVTARVAEDGGKTLLAILDAMTHAPGIDLGLVIVSLVATERLVRIEPQLKALYAAGGHPLVFHSPGTPGEAALEVLTRVGGVHLELADFARAMVLLTQHQEFRERWQARQPDAAPEPALAASADMGTRELLDRWHVRQPAQALARDAEQAVQAAAAMPGAVALKIVSPDIAHKTDAGGVLLGLSGADAVRSGFARIMQSVQAHLPQARIDGIQVQQMLAPGREMVVGTVRDPDFGPMVMLGFGGIYVEVLRDVTFELAPLTLEQAHAMIGRLRGRALLDGVRGESAADTGALAELLVAVSRMAGEPGSTLREMELNPVIVYPQGQGAFAVDALIVRDN